MKLPRLVLWKAKDGREFTIDMEKEKIGSMEDLHKYIDELRKEHGYETPELMSVVTSPGIDPGSGVYFENLSDSFKQKVIQSISEVKPDPKKLN